MHRFHNSLPFRCNRWHLETPWMYMISIMYFYWICWVVSSFSLNKQSDTLATSRKHTIILILRKLGLSGVTNYVNNKSLKYGDNQPLSSLVTCFCPDSLYQFELLTHWDHVYFFGDYKSCLLLILSSTSGCLKSFQALFTCNQC